MEQLGLALAGSWRDTEQQVHFPGCPHELVASHTCRHTPCSGGQGTGATPLGALMSWVQGYRPEMSGAWAAMPLHPGGHLRGDQSTLAGGSMPGEVPFSPRSHTMSLVWAVDSVGPVVRAPIGQCRCQAGSSVPREGAVRDRAEAWGLMVTPPCSFWSLLHQLQAAAGAIRSR